MAEDIVTGAQRAATNAILGRLGDLVTSVWDFSLGFVVDFIFLERNAEKLAEELQRLEELRDDLRNRAANEARQPYTDIASQVSGWVKRVEKQESEFARFQYSLDRLSICTVDGFRLGHTAAEMLRRVEQLMVQGSALMQQGELVTRRRPEAVERVPFENSSRSIVGAETALKQLQAHIMDDRVGIIGIYGMGGIGKTTILKVIHNEFLQEEAKDKYHLAIWVTVSQQVDIWSIQNDIGKRLNLSLPGDDRQDASSRLITERANILVRELSGKKFILFLDDVWNRLDIVNIGIPLPKNEKNNCKILFATRSKEVCNVMDADQKVEVSLLDDENSWRLFLSKVGSEVVTKDGKIQQLARQVATRCGGLPISVITVGRAMADARTPNDWRNAINSFNHRATELSGMDEVLASLKFSFDMLKNDTLRSCLLYCVLFPRICSIPKGEIIDYWICEGFLDPGKYQDTHIDQTRDRGHDQIRQLQNACLLEEGNILDDQETVRLHDTIRDMALWITGEKFLVHTTRLPEMGTWKSVERVSLMWNRIMRDLPAPETSCPNLTTLFLRSSILKQQAFDGFFKYAPALRVLDLCYVMSVPSCQIPVGTALPIMLQYLNLRGTLIKSLPKELGSLIHLRQLIMDETILLTTIPREAISPLSRLQVLSIWQSSYVFMPGSDQLALNDLQNLRRLCELSLRVQSWQSLKTIVGSNLLRRCVRYLHVVPDDAHASLEGDTMSVSKAIGDMPQLSRLSLQDSKDNSSAVFHPCPHPSLEILHLHSFKTVSTFVPHQASSSIDACEIPFQRLTELQIDQCDGLTELSWVDQLPCLKFIRVRNCRKVRVVLRHSDGLLQEYYCSLFSNLQKMILVNLPALRSISPYPVLFPSLEELSVDNCSLLTRLPFGPQSAKKLKRITGNQEWWDRLEWHPSSVKSSFLAHFKA